MSLSPCVLVTGAAGFIGSHTSERFLREGYTVLGVDNLDTFYAESIKRKNIAEIKRTAESTRGKFYLLEKDINDLKTTDFSEFKIDQIVHLAARAGVRPSIKDPMSYLKANVEGTIRLLDFARERAVEEFILGSSSSVYGNSTPVPFSEVAPAVEPISPYAASKRMAELYAFQFAHLYPIRVVSLRFFTVFGPRQRPDLAIHQFTKKILNGETITLFGDGKTSRDYTFVADIVDGILLATQWLKKNTQKRFETFNLGGNHPVSLVELVSNLEKAVEKKAEIKWASMQAGDVERTFADLTRSTTVLGYRPRVSLAEGLKSFVEWMRSAERLKPTIG